MTPIEKLLAAEQRILDCVEGRAPDIVCPFCGLRSSPANELLCCNALADMVTAVLDHLDVKTTVNRAQQAVEQYHEIQVKQNKVVLN